MSEKRTLSNWLRSKDVYQDVATEESEPQAKQWRSVLLAEFDAMAPASPQKSASQDAARSPLEIHHLLMMMPVGLVLFATGWLFGSEAISPEQIAGVSPWVWVGISVVGSVGFLTWRGQAISWRR